MGNSKQSQAPDYIDVFRSYFLCILSSIFSTHPFCNMNMNVTTILALLAIGLAAGMLSSMVGIGGGGRFIVPALVFYWP